MKTKVYDKKTKELIQVVEGIQENTEVFIKTVQKLKNPFKEKYTKKQKDLIKEFLDEMQQVDGCEGFYEVEDN